MTRIAIEAARLLAITAFIWTVCSLANALAPYAPLTGAAS